MLSSVASRLRNSDAVKKQTKYSSLTVLKLNDSYILFFSSSLFFFAIFSNHVEGIRCDTGTQVCSNLQHENDRVCHRFPPLPNSGDKTVSYGTVPLLPLWFFRSRAFSSCAAGDTEKPRLVRLSFTAAKFIIFQLTGTSGKE